MGVGNYSPKKNNVVYDKEGAQYNLGEMIRICEKSKQRSQKDYCLTYNEYVVYKPEQVNIKYLLKIEMKKKE